MPLVIAGELELDDLQGSFQTKLFYGSVVCVKTFLKSAAPETAEENLIIIIFKQIEMRKHY